MAEIDTKTGLEGIKTVKEGIDTVERKKLIVEQYKKDVFAGKCPTKPEELTWDEECDIIVKWLNELGE